MYFGRDGYVTACCYSRTAPVGQYPKQSVSEIWSGEAMAALRGSMRRNELPRGCETCADQLLAGNYKGLLASHFDNLAVDPAQQAGNPSYPSLMEFELSNKCNLECEMCTGFFSSSIRANREGLPALPLVYDNAFVDQLSDFIPHLKRAKFLGGEPFLIDLYYQIWELFIQKNPSCEIAITTNGTVFTAKVRRVLENLNCTIVVSLDSLDSQVYASIRRNAQLTPTLANLKEITAINRAKSKGLWLSVCPMTTNWQGIPDLVAFANQNHMTMFFNTVVSPHHLALKSLPGARLESISSFLRESVRPAGAANNGVEASNQQALLDLCHQVDQWAKEGQASGGGMQSTAYRLASAADAGKFTPKTRAVLLVLGSSELTERELIDTLSVDDGPDPKANLRDLYTAIWTAGRALADRGHLPGAKFDPADLEELLSLFEQQVPEAYLPVVCRETQRNIRTAVQFLGSTPPSQILQLTSRMVIGTS